MERVAFEAPSEYSDGSGYGSGDGSGYGSGDGSGYGSGYGSGSGYGDGYGDGSIAYCAALTDIPEAYIHREAGAVVALWRSNVDGTPANGGTNTKAVPGLVEETPGPLELCKSGTLHATFRPEKWQGGRLWVVALYGDVAITEDKLGALKRVIIAEVPGGSNFCTKAPT